MIEIRDFILEMKEQNISYNYYKLYFSEDNNFDLLKKRSDKILKELYLNHIFEAEYTSINQQEILNTSKQKLKLENKFRDFDSLNRHKIFRKYDIQKIIENCGDTKKAFINEKHITNAYDILKELLEQYSKTSEIENFVRCGNISLKNIPDNIYANGNYISKNKDSSYCINRVKNLFNTGTYFSIEEIENSKVEMKIIIDEIHTIRYKIGNFLTDWNRISYREFQEVLREHKINPSEFWHIILNFDKIYSKNKIKTAHKNLNIVKNKESIEIPTVFNSKNEYEDEFNLILKDEYATSKVIKKVEYNGEILVSHFSDFQAFHICRGLKNQRPLYNKYLNKNYTENDIYRAHELANKLLKNHGKKMIDFLLSLPTLPFKSENFKILFSTLDKIKEKGINKNPTIRLKIKNENDDFDEVEFSFHSIDKTDYVNQISIKNITKKNSVCIVSREGKVLPSENTSETGKNKNITPVLKLFYQITKDKESLDNEILSFGLETGKCSICGRRLEDENSILKGIGPICESYLL